MKAKTEREEQLKMPWKRLLNYQSIVQQIPFFLFVTTLAVIYIYNGHMADRMMRKIMVSGRQLKDLQNEYKSVKGDALLRSKKSEMTEAVKTLGLTELKVDPVVLIDSSTIQENN